jgi:lipoprotein-anchoring transpeptidase ErfK/SrfK
MTIKRVLFGLTAAAMMVVVPVLSATAEAKRQSDKAETKRVADGLQINVDVGGQNMEVYADGKRIHRWAISTGRDGYDTPGGTFRPQRLEREWFSKKYDDAPMPYSIFYSGGFAIHGTNDTRRLGRTASHGCIRLSPGNAARLFGLVQDYGAGRTRIVIDN